MISPLARSHEPQLVSARPPTRIALLLLTLITGLAVGYAVRDLTTRTTATPQQAASLPTLPTLPTQTIATPQQAAPLPTLPARPTRTIATPQQAAPLPTLPAEAGFIGYTVRAGDTLAGIAATTGGDAAQIRRNNRLTGEPAAERALIIARGSAAPPVASETLLVTRGSRAQPLLALTLDAGANAELVPAMLATLRARGVRITFFVTGAFARDNPALIGEMRADDHEIENHSMSHPDFRRLSDAGIADELASTDAAIGARTIYFRPPYGATDQRVLEQTIARGYLPIYWTLDSLDSVGEPKSADFIFNRVTKNLTDADLRGAIILAHCSSTGTAEALPLILDDFAQRGFVVTTLTAVLNVP